LVLNDINPRGNNTLLSTLLLVNDWCTCQFTTSSFWHRCRGLFCFLL